MKKTGIYTLLLIAGISCNKQDNVISGKIETVDVTEITETSAVCGGLISFKSQGKDAFGQIVQKGIIWDTSADDIKEYPEHSSRYSSSKTNNEPFFDDSGNFLCQMSGLTPNTTYYVRVFVQFGKAKEKNFAYGAIQSFTTTNNKPQHVLVRFRKDADDPYMTEMAIDDVNDRELASHYFGSGVGMSQYYEIPPGSHYLWFYDNFPGYEDWFTCFDDPYNFQAGRKYTVVCAYKDEDKFLLDFNVTDDGAISISDISVKSSAPVKSKKPENKVYRQNSRARARASVE